ncbi:MAG: YHS domain-containing (seleno)protein [Rhodovibrionaceae bacterium]
MRRRTAQALTFDRRKLLSGLLVLSLALFAAPGAVRAEVYRSEGIALGGSDPVAYFTEGKAVQGSSEFSADYDGATWHFASAANRDAFAADPESYAPRYGGYCAYAAAAGAKAKTVPEAWKIVDGKLYLNFSKAVQSRWEEDIPGYIAKADANWPNLK